MGEQGGLRTGWIAAFGTEGYEGEPPLLEELGVNFGHIKGKVRKKESQAAKQRASYMYRVCVCENGTVQAHSSLSRPMAWLSSTAAC